MKKPFLTAKKDRVFKAIMGDEDNKELLKEFLQRIFETKVEILEFLQPELTIQTIEERTKQVDLLVKMNDKFVHIELNSQSKNFLHNRNFIFFTTIFNKKTKRGKEYDIKTEYIHIDFSYGIGLDPKDYRQYYVMDETSKKYVENIKIIEYNMDRITKYYKSNDQEKIKKYKHLIMLDLDKSDLRNLSKGDDFIMKFDEELEELNRKETYEPAMSWEEDYELRLNTEIHEATDKAKAEGRKEGIEEGIKEGIEEGIKESSINIARNLLKDNIPLEQIKKYTNLSLEEINEIKNEM